MQNVLKIQPLTLMQEGMLFHSLLDTAGKSYRIQVCYNVEGNVDGTLLKKAWLTVFSRHEVFRTDFVWKAIKSPVQIILKEKEVMFTEYDLSSLSEDEQVLQIAQIKEKDLAKIQLEENQLNHLALIKKGEKKYLICWTHHHLLLDGWSLSIVLKDFLQVYKALAQGDNLPAVPVEQFSTYLEWLKKQNKTAGLHFWKERIKELDRPTFFPGDFKSSEGKTRETRAVRIELDQSWTAQLIELCQKYKITANAFFQTAWAIFVQRYTNTNVSCAGMTVSGRPASLRGVESIVGLCINTIPVVIASHDRETVSDLLLKVNQQLVECRDYEHIALGEIKEVGGLDPTKEMFNSIVVYENQPFNAVEEASGLVLTFDSTFGFSNYDLTVIITMEETTGVTLTYDVDVFTPTTVEHIKANFHHLLLTMIRRQSDYVKDLSILSDLERECLDGFNQTQKVYNLMQPAQSVFEEQVKRTPDRRAVVCGDQSMTYTELNGRANRLAMTLREKGIGREQFVGIMLEPSLSLPVAILGVLKAGAAFLPVDPKYPLSRIEYMITDSEARLLITESHLPTLRQWGGERLNIDAVVGESGVDANPVIVNKAEDCAYMIYTSGSTGAPKGVMIEHKSLLNLVYWHNEFYGVTELDRSTKYAGVGFDASVWEIFPYLLCGAEIHIISEEIKLDVAALSEYYERNGITISFLPTQICERFMELGKTSLRYLLAGGDKLNYWKDGGYKLVNNYGPTENTVVTTCFPVERDEANIPIGKPIANQTAYVINHHGQLQPVNAPGELCISGVGLARGYWNRPELTKEKFVENPFKPGTLMYKTGDLVKWLPDGNLVFLGRIDQQVKIRGFRIELGEIESHLINYPGVKEALVVVKEDVEGAKYLCAYLVQETAVNIAGLREELAAVLPDYMIPAHFMVLTEFPLTLNGKIDRNALPEPDGQLEKQHEYVAPRNLTEEKIAAIFRALLKIEQVGIYDNFFELGGHSLKATQLAARISREFKVQIPLLTIFEIPTIAEIAHYLGASAEEQETVVIDKAADQPSYPVSSAQKRLYALQQQSGSGIHYNLPAMMEIVGEFDFERFAAAFRKLVERHESLRTSFDLVNGEVVQRVHPVVDFPVDYLTAEKEELNRLIREFMQPFDLAQAPLFRIAVVKSGTEHLLMLDMHHIIADGFSLDVLFTELGEFYAGKALPEVKLQYRDFAVWQQNQTGSEKLKVQEEYWLKTFAGEISLLNLPTDHSRPAAKDFAGDLHYFTLSEESSAQVMEIANRSGATLYMILLAAFNVLLARYSGQEDIIVGSPTAGRPVSDLEGTVGMFVNTLAMRNQVNWKLTFNKFLNAVKVNTLAAFANQEYQFEALVDKLNIGRDLSRNPLFDVMFAMQNANDTIVKLPQITLRPYRFDYKIAKFDLTLNAYQSEQQIQFILEYSTSLFGEGTMKRFAGHYLNLLESILRNPDTLLTELEMISTDERNLLLYDLNATAAAYPREKTVDQLFAEQVACTPEGVAIVDGAVSWTYRELNARANQLARVLQAKGAGPERIVGILLKPSIEMFIGMLAVLKVGAAFLPLDPKLPAARLEFMLANSEAGLALTKRDLWREIAFAGEVIDVSNLPLKALLETNLEQKAEPGNLAYVIYTSGSTGEPKGVMVEHRSLVNLCCWHNAYYQVTPADRSTKYASFGFDASVWEVFPYLLAGASIYLIPDELLLDVEGLHKFFTENAITISFLPTPICEQFIRSGSNSLKRLLTGGDKLKYYQQQNYLLYNNYGPTENTVVTTCFPVQGNWVDIPVGRPIYNTSVYVLDQNQQLQPLGVPGELWISGDSLARGYLKSPELTGEKFIANPYKAGERLYRTGDLVRWLPSGFLEFRGRIDQQVKTRGYRIELGEIENVLLRHPLVNEAIVLNRAYLNGNQLCAYFTGKQELTKAELTEYLAEKLPDYMIPAYFVQLALFPLTRNGKVDRQALLDRDDLTQVVDYIEPVSPAEKQLAQVWAEVLGNERVGTEDPFFDLGGDSIKAIQIISRANQWGLRFTVKDIFKYKTIAGLLKNVDQTSARIEAAQSEVVGEVPFTPIQHWFFAMKFQHPEYFNQAFLFTVPEDIDAAVLEAAWRKIIHHHDALRLKFVDEAGQVAQVNRGQGEVEFKLECLDLSGDSAPQERLYAYSREIQQNFNLEQDLPVKVVLVNLGTSAKRLLVVAHHLVIDGVSWRILLEDLVNLYHSGGTANLPLKTTSYQDWSRRLQLYAEHEPVDTGYWDSLDPGLSNFRRDLPEDRRYCRYTNMQIELYPGETESLLKKVNWAYNTEVNDILLTALQMTLTDVFAVDEVLIHLEGHGRVELLPEVDLSRTVGWFTSIYPVHFQRQEGLAANLQHVKESLRSIPHKGIGYGIARYLRGENELPAFAPEIAFNYLGQFEQLESNQFLTLAPEDFAPGLSGENEYPYLVNVNGLVTDGRLQLTLTYHTDLFTAEEMQHFGKRYLHQLREIIAHCIQQTKRTYTVSDFGLSGMLTQEDLAHLGERFDLARVKIFPLTSMQEGMLFHYNLDTESTHYREQVVFYMNGNLDLGSLSAAWQNMVNRHEIMRTAFVWKMLSKPVQIIQAEQVFDITAYDLSGISAGEQEERLSRLKTEQLEAEFDFAEGRLSKVIFIRLSKDRFCFLWTFHHILLDGWSIQVILKDFLDAYQGQELGSEPAQFSSYLEWLQNQNRQKMQAFWQNALQVIEEPSLILTDYRSEEAIKVQHTGLFTFDSTETAHLYAFCRKHSITMNVLLQTCWSLLLQKYMNSQISCFGSPVSGRPAGLPGVEQIAGLFINTLPVIVQSEPGEQVISLLQKVHENLVEMRNYEFISLAEIQKLKDWSGPLFNTIMVFENYPVAVEDKDNGLRLQLDSYNDVTNYDLTLVTYGEDQLVLRLQANAALFEKASIERIAGHFVQLLRNMVDDAKRPVAEVSMLTSGDRQWIFHEVNATAHDYPRDICIQEFFEAWGVKNPEKAALVFKGDVMTYGELNRRANQLAHRLIKAGTGTEAIIGIMVNPSFEMFIAILGVLKAGAAYLPIDPNYPVERIEFMLKDSKCLTLLTESALVQKVHFAGEIIDLQDAALYQGDDTQPVHFAGAHNLAYVIYTSGTTGVPKGVEIEHHSLVNMVCWHIDYYGVTENDRNTKYAGFSFDASAWEIFPYLSAGATIHIIPEELKLNLPGLNQYFEQARITLSFLPTQVGEQFLTLSNNSLRCVQIAGEKLKYWEPKPYRVVNNYGPTENTVVATCYPVEHTSYNIPVGKPVSNVKVFVLDHASQLQPVGAVGELWIAGEGLARCYLGRPDLTAEKFVTVPWYSGRLYRTGDLARWRNDGNLEFLGRVDQQVKIRGYRVELAEIEQQLLTHPGVQEAVVIDRPDDDGTRYIIGYVVSKTAVAVEELRQYLTAKLPAFMVPAYFVNLSAIPLTVNGKVDRRALPEPVERGAQLSNYVPPKDAVEVRLVQIWKVILGRDTISVEDNFFELGAHSLKAIQLVSQVYKEFGVEITLRRIFAAPTVRKQAEYIRTARQKAYQAIKPVKAQEYYPVSSAQKRLFALRQIDGESTSYNIPFALEVKGSLDPARLKAAFQGLISRHESLRTSFTLRDGQVVQAIHREVNLPIVNISVQDAELAAVTAGFVQPFDLTQAPLLRAALVKSEQRQLLLVDMHHIIADGGSIDVFFAELQRLYAGEELSRMEIQYKDFAAWQNDFLNSSQMKAQEEYWLKQLAGEPVTLNLPLDYSRPAVINNTGAMYQHVLTEQTVSDLRGLARRSGATLYMVMLAIFEVLLAKYSGQEDIIVGTPVSGRRNVELENLIGMFVNTLAIRNQPTREKSFERFLAEVKAGVVTAMEHQDYQFEMLVDRLKLERDLSRNPVFDVVFSMQSVAGEAFRLGDAELSAYPLTYTTAKFDLTMIVVETPEQISLNLEYMTRLFKQETIVRLAQHFERIITTVAANSFVKLPEIELISPAEKVQILTVFNNTQVEYPVTLTIQQLFEQQVEQHPDKPAIVFGAEQLTYRELNAKANQLAHLFRTKGVKPDEVVGIYALPSLEMLIGVLAIIKAGGAYLPVDPDYPESRIAYMLEDSSVRILLTPGVELAAKFTGTLFNLADPELYQGDDSNLPNLNSHTDLIYIIYTSGSTGLPKGVMVQHYNVNRLITNSNMLQIAPDERILQTGSLAFDASTFEIWGTLLNGATLYLISQNQRLSIEQFKNVLQTKQISMIWLTSPLFNQLLEEDQSIFSSLQTLIVGGDALSPKHINRVRALHPQLKVVNGYGPTESTTFATYLVIDHDYLDNIPIGYPISNTQVYILDSDNHILPVGVPGELCIGGDGLARGYLRQPELTAEKFVPNPFAPGERMYRTGDKARWLPDGKVEFMGRLDQQVKIRGFRIELGEIENVLLQHPDVLEGVVVDRVDADGKKYLAAYYVPVRELPVSALRQHMVSQLPGYMIPGYFVALPKLPLNQNGKVDYRALPEPRIEVLEEDEYTAPETAAEQQLADIWADILNLDRIGTTDNFFELGGDSIKAIRILARASEQGLNLTVEDIFKWKTIADILAHADLHKKKKEISQDTVTGQVPLTPIQAWFFAQNLTQQQYFNQYYLLGLKDDVKLELLEQAFQRCIEHHDALRMSYLLSEGGVHQLNRHTGDVSFKLSVVNLSGLPYEQQKAALKAKSEELQNSFNLENDLLLKAVVFDLGSQGKRLLIIAHHLIIDGVSWRILLEDLEKLYTSHLTVALPLKTTSFKEWSERLHAEVGTREVDLGFWLNIDPVDIDSFQNTAVPEESKFSDMQRVSIVWDEAQTDVLLKKAGWAYNTEINDLLLAAAALAVTDVFASKQILFNLEGHGREEIIEDVDLSRTIGWFTSAYPVHLRRYDSIEEMLKHTKESLRQIPGRGINFGIGKYIQQNPHLAKLEPKIAFNYLGQFDELGGSSTVFASCTEDAGASIHPLNRHADLVDFNGMVHNGRLHFDILYNSAVITAEAAERLKTAYHNRLNEIVEHCVSRQEKTFTASDFGVAEKFDQDDFDMLSELYEFE